MSPVSGVAIALLLVVLCGCEGSSQFRYYITGVFWTSGPDHCIAIVQEVVGEEGRFAAARVPMDSKSSAWSSHQHTEWFDGPAIWPAPVSATEMYCTGIDGDYYGVLITDQSPLDWRRFEYPKDWGFFYPYPTENGLLIGVIPGDKQGPVSYEITPLSRILGDSDAPEPLELEERPRGIRASPALFSEYDSPLVMEDIGVPARILKIEWNGEGIRLRERFQANEGWMTRCYNAKGDHLAVIGWPLAKVVNLENGREVILCSVEGLDDTNSYSVCLDADGSHAAYMRPDPDDENSEEMEVVLVPLGETGRIKTRVPAGIRSRILSFIPGTTDVLVGDCGGLLSRLDIGTGELTLLLEAPRRNK